MIRFRSMRARALAANVTFAGAVVVSACALTADLDGLTGGDGPPADGGADTAVTQLDDGGARADAAPTCAGTHGPTPVALDGFCIDSTEVTVAQYRDFRRAKDEDFGGQPSYCAWNTTWTPTIDSGDDGDPVFGANWCQAYAFCAWSGKRLCGLAPHGAPPAPLQVDTTADEWFSACTADGTRNYAYGADYVKGTCNVALSRGPWQAGSRAACQGGYPGIFDLNGNLWEWEAACDAPDGGGDQHTLCTMRGGSFSPGNTASCRDTYGVARDQTIDHVVNDVGIRCCSDLR